MNYELAKELKEAGFDQEKHGDGFWWPFTVPVVAWNAAHAISLTEVDDNSANGLYNRIANPKLEELIEACGEGFDYLDAPLWGDTEDKNWYAHGWGNELGEGPDPLTAVARLYIALNRNAKES